jgi:hypothetical protein
MTRSPRRLLLLALVLLLVTGYGVATAVGSGYLSGTRSYRTGVCVHRAGDTVEPAACAGPEALRIAARVSAARDCPRETMLAFTARGGDRFVLCLVPG